MIGTMLLAAALLLAGAGAAKLGSPTAAAGMLRRAGWRWLGTAAARTLVRAGGVVELAVGLVAIATGSRPASALLAACYLTFLIVAARLLRRGQRASCGCFGATDSPVGAGHLVVNAIAVGLAIAATVRAPGPLGGRFHGSVLAGAVSLGQAVLLAYLAFLSITALPALTAARRRLLEAA